MDGFDVDVDALPDFDHRIPTHRRAAQLDGTWMATASHKKRDGIPPAEGADVSEPVARVKARADGTFGRLLVLTARPPGARR